MDLNKKNIIPIVFGLGLDNLLDIKVWIWIVRNLIQNRLIAILRKELITGKSSVFASKLQQTGLCVTLHQTALDISLYNYAVNQDTETIKGSTVEN